MSSTISVPTPIGLRCTLARPTYLAFSWAPTVGATQYMVVFRKFGTTQWYVGSRTTNPYALVMYLNPRTKYEIEVVASAGKI